MKFIQDKYLVYNVIVYCFMFNSSRIENIYWPVYRDKGTPPKKGGGPVLLLQNYPHSLSLRGRGPYHFPLPLTLEPPEHDYHLPFYFFPLNKKENTELDLIWSLKCYITIEN